MPARKPTVAAVFNTSPHLVDLVRRACEPAGILVVSLLPYQIREGGADLKSFLAHYDPDVVVYDIAPPYDANWQLFKHIRSLDSMQDRKMVLTSINEKRLSRLVHAVKEVSRQRPSR